MGLILVDMGGTLLFYTMDPDNDFGPNNDLIQVLNAASAAGYEVQIVSGAVDEGSYKHACFDLKKAGLGSDIIDNAQGKEAIKPETYSGVVAIIDDKLEEEYVGEVMEGNPKARQFSPTDTAALAEHLGVSVPAQAPEPPI